MESKTFFAGSIQSISRAASPQKPFGVGKRARMDLVVAAACRGCSWRVSRNAIVTGWRAQFKPDTLVLCLCPRGERSKPERSAGFG